MAEDTQAVAAPAAKKVQVPQYRLTGPVYVNETLYDQGAVDRAPEPGILIYFKGIPNHHMEPVNDAAREMVKKHPPSHMSAVDRLTQITPDAPTLGPR